MTCVLFDRQLCATFLVEDPDIETMKRELKDAFRFQFLNFLERGEKERYTDKKRKFASYIRKFRWDRSHI
jgi:hypothetical protein